jgi:DNA-directed RNA polymerase specialized sigma24 family protein
MKIINPIYDQAFKYNLKQYLNRATQDEEMIRILELEEDIDQEFEKLETALDLARQGEEEERKQKEEALEIISNMIKNLHAKGLSVSEIATITGKPESEIKKMLK